MLETLLQYADSEIIHTICSKNNIFSLSFSKELKNIGTDHIEHFLDIEVTSLPLYKILSTVEKEVTE